MLLLLATHFYNKAMPMTYCCENTERKVMVEKSKFGNNLNTLASNCA
jgi:hypothetical protein